MTILRYCDKKTRAALQKLVVNGVAPACNSPMWCVLKSRGWMNADSQPTQRGIDYLGGHHV